MNRTNAEFSRNTFFGALALILLLATGCSAFTLEPPRKSVVATATIRPPFTPRPSSTAWPTFTPSPTFIPVTPGIVSGVISATVNIRMGPGSNYPVVTKLNKGTKVNLRGRDVAGQWFVLVPPPNGWVNLSFLTLSGEAKSLPLIDAPPTLVPTPTFAPTWTPMPTATPPMYVDFRADTPWVIAGQCTTLRWDVEGVRGVYLEGRGQPGHGSQDVCPTETHTYVLHVALKVDYLDRAITIAVLAAQPTSAK